MAWEILEKRLTPLPLVLAGPILRQVTTDAVTVWVALRREATVALTVYDSDKQARTTLMSAIRATTAVGKNLHIVAVTARAKNALSEGNLYFYDLEFRDPLGSLTTLTEAITMFLAKPDPSRLAYPPFTLPSFALPPKDPNSLRLIQGSCRMPHANGKDTLPIVDDLIANSAPNAFARPHQLLLTGDQIYADDVADTLLLMLTDAGDTLLGWAEFLPPGNLLPAQLPPYWREKPLKDAGFTSVDLRSHLLSLGEYLSMYLFVWSDVLWPATSGLPTIHELAAKVSSGGPPGSDSRPVMKEVQSRQNTIQSDINALADFSQSLPKVRRALANIPSYMIFDDHEVTDDWNMTREFCRNFYGKPLGQRVARNALIAYALCQHWGNAPEQFAGSLPQPPGLDLLGLLNTPFPTATNAFDGKAARLSQQSASITALLGLHDDTDLARKPHKLFHEGHSLQYHYTVEGPGHQVIFTDTRTWRSFPHGGTEGSEIFPKEQFKQQILDAQPATGDRVLLVVLSTNAPPVEPIRAAKRNAGIVNRFEHYPDVYEAWETPVSQLVYPADSAPFDRLLKTLTDKLPLDSHGHHAGQVILLSGDVHHSFASRLVYRATNRFEDATPQPATAVFAQLVASAFKKQTEGTIGFHREGYTYAPRIGKVMFLVRPHRPEGYVGWNLSSKTNVGDMVITSRQMGFDNPQTIETKVPLALSVPITLECEEMILTPGGVSTFMSLELRVAPHYRYRLDYLLPNSTGIQIKVPPLSVMPAGTTPDQRKEAAKVFRERTALMRTYNAFVRPKVVGVNNFGEITFIWPKTGPDKKVNHTLRWWSKSDVTVTTYTVSLNPNDADPSGKLKFPDIKAKVEP